MIWEILLSSASNQQNTMTLWKVSNKILPDFFPNSSECVTYLDWRSEMIIFESLLTPFEAIVIFEAAGTVVVVVKIGRSLKTSQSIALYNYFYLRQNFTFLLLLYLLQSYLFIVSHYELSEIMSYSVVCLSVCQHTMKPLNVTKFQCFID